MRIAFLALAVSACATTESQRHPAGPDDTCGSSHVADKIGQLRTDALVAEVARRSGAARVRWIRPSDAVTMDFLSDRLNVHLDAQGRIESLSCG